MSNSNGEDRARGLMLGLLVGDASDELVGDPKGSGLLRGTALAQIACYTIEGLIRALMRDEYKESVLDPLGCVWRAYGRWAVGRGLRLAPSLAAEVEHTGWLRQVSTLSAPRGAAPATASALGSRRGDIRSPVGTSAGHHALNRSLPLALIDSYSSYHEKGARELAALTHGAPGAWDAAAAAVLVLAAALDATSVAEAVGVAIERSSRAEVAKLLTGDDSGAAIDTAAYCLTRGLRTASAGGTIRQVVERAHVYGRGTATFAGALHGAVHGIHGIETNDILRLEIGWVADQLAKDVVRQETEHPGPGWMAAGNPIDPLWIARYPPN